MTSEIKEPEENQPIERLKFWPNLGTSFKHIRESVRSEGNRIRKTDPITIFLVPVACIVLAYASFASGWLRLLIATLTFFSMLFYVAARIGIVRSMNHRQTNLVWHIMMAMFMAGIVFALMFKELVIL